MGKMKRPDNTVEASAAKIRSRLKLDGLYPFKSRFIDTPMGLMHYVDEGAGAVVLMLHGNPTWSFLYRDFIVALSDSHRVVAPDHIGFGLSEKPNDEAFYSIDGHIRNLETLVTSLDLKDVTLIMQDWGGPIGLGMAARHPTRIKALVILNTFGFYPPADHLDPENLILPAPLRLMRTKIVGDFLVRNLGFFERVAMPTAVASGKRWKAVRHAYTGVFERHADRAGVMAFPRLIPTNTRHPTAQLMIKETGPFIDKFDGPVRGFWGVKDPFFPIEVLHAWKKRLPRARFTELPQAKHYIQEDAPDPIVAALQAFLAEI
jgi:haloalkane dehalogenase